MSNSLLVITISGCSGGNQGPLGIYPLLPTLWKNTHVTLLNWETTPDSVQDNVKQISQILFTQHVSEKILLIGYSKGGAVAIQVAQGLPPDRVEGIVFLSTQTDGLYPAIDPLKTRALFFHGSQDPYFRLWQIESLFKRYVGPKKMIVLEGLDHGMKPVNMRRVSIDYSRQLARLLIHEISGFLIEKQEPITPERTARIGIPISWKDRWYNRLFAW